ncbi:MAG TPA: hypothetical protein VIH13_01720, partial [Candidatus Hydromicrobium sp.]
MKKIISFLAVIFILLLASGCKLADEKVSEETIEEEAAEEEEEVIEPSVTYSGGLEDTEIAFVCASVGSNWNI